MYTNNVESDEVKLHVFFSEVKMQKHPSQASCLVIA